VENGNTNIKITPSKCKNLVTINQTSVKSKSNKKYFRLWPI